MRSCTERGSLFVVVGTMRAYDTVTAARTFGSTAQVTRMGMIAPSVFSKSSVLS